MTLRAKLSVHIVFLSARKVLPVPINIQCLAKYSESNEQPPLSKMRNFTTSRATKAASFVASTAVPAYTHGSGSERPPLLVSKLQRLYLVYDTLLWCLPRINGRLFRVAGVFVAEIFYFLKRRLHTFV